MGLATGRPHLAGACVYLCDPWDTGGDIANFYLTANK